MQEPFVLKGAQSSAQSLLHFPVCFRKRGQRGAADLVEEEHLLRGVGARPDAQEPLDDALGQTRVLLHLQSTLLDRAVLSSKNSHTRFCWNLTAPNRSNKKSRCWGQTRDHFHPLCYLYCIGGICPRPRDARLGCKPGWGDVLHHAVAELLVVGAEKLDLRPRGGWC